MEQIEEEKRDHMEKMKRMEGEMEQVFEMKVKEKLHKLKESEGDVSLLLCFLLCLFEMLLSRFCYRNIFGRKIFVSKCFNFDLFN